MSEFAKWCKENHGHYYYDKELDMFLCAISKRGRIYRGIDEYILTDEEFQQLARKMWKVIFADAEGEE
jgi:DNA-binding helix-hairpin-helix protein with protein kinase domain